MEKMKIALKVIQNVIEELWTVLVIIWNVPVGIIELVWTALFNKEKFVYNWGLLKDAIKGKNMK
jgi:hypothetical protein